MVAVEKWSVTRFSNLLTLAAMSEAVLSLGSMPRMFGYDLGGPKGFRTTVQNDMCSRTSKLELEVQPVTASD